MYLYTDSIMIPIVNVRLHLCGLAAALPQVHPQAARRQSAPTEVGADSEEAHLAGERPRCL